MIYKGTSAVENLNVNESFIDLAKEIFKIPELWKFEDMEKNDVVLAGKLANQGDGDDPFLELVFNLLLCGGRGDKGDAEKKKGGKDAIPSDDEEESEIVSNFSEDESIDRKHKVGYLNRCNIY